MSRLFIAFYLDENVDISVAPMVRAAGLECVTARDAHMLRQPDEAHLAHAADAGFAVVTLDRGDYLALHAQFAASGRHHAGIVIAFARPARRLADDLIEFADRWTADEVAGQVLYV